MNRRTFPPISSRRDDGSVLVITLVFMVVGSLIVTGLLSFAGAIFRARPPIGQRNAAAESARSGVRMALTEQRFFGTEDCHEAQTTYTLNGYPTTVTCEVISGQETFPGRLGVITTLLNTGSTALAGDQPPKKVKDIYGDVFIAGGLLDGRTTDIMPRKGVFGSTYVYDQGGLNVASTYVQGGVQYPCGDPAVQPLPGYAAGASVIDGLSFDPVLACLSVPWWERAGDDPELDGLWKYPLLPPLPTYVRTGADATWTNPTTTKVCKVYFPGRYDQPLNLASGDHYFASGVYYLTKPMTLANGARVVAGEGEYEGCLVDADAAQLSTAPAHHEITGAGATFLLGKQGQIVINKASFKLNRRVATPGTSASQGIGIRTVFTIDKDGVDDGLGFAISSTDLQIPTDQVLLFGDDPATPLVDETTIEPALTHTIPVGLSSTARYDQSELTWDQAVLDVDLTGGTSATDDFVAVDGYIFTPNAKVILRSDNQQVQQNQYYNIRIRGGLVVSRIEMNINETPFYPDKYVFGVQSIWLQRTFRLTSTTTTPRAGQTTSTAIMQLNLDGKFAVNYWVLDN